VEQSENKPTIHIHLDQQVTIESVRGQEEVEDAAVATEITGFAVEDDLYVLRGALTFTGFLRQEEEGAAGELPDAFDDRDLFATEEEAAEAPVLPLHHSMPFVLQVPVEAQEVHQRENGVLNVNPKIGKWNLHVLGEQTVHVRAELIIQGLSAQGGYVFRCGTQEEGGTVASKLDHLLDQEESRPAPVPAPAHSDEAFEPPFEPAWSLEQAEVRSAEAAMQEAQEAQEEDWYIESPQAAVEGVGEGREEEEETEGNEVVFTPDPALVFPMPEQGSAWARELEAAEGSYGQAPPVEGFPFPGVSELTPQGGFSFSQLAGREEFKPPSPEAFTVEPYVAEGTAEETDDEDAFVLEDVREEQGDETSSCNFTHEALGEERGEQPAGVTIPGVIPVPVQPDVYVPLPPFAGQQDHVQEHDHEQQDHEQQIHGQQDHDQQDHGQQDHDQQDHGQQDHGQQDHEQQDHEQQDHEQQDHGQQIHGQQDHDQQDHGQQIHGQQDHGQQDYEQQAHDQQIHGQQIRGQQAHEQLAHDQQAHDQQGHDQQAHDQQAHDQQAHDQLVQGRADHGQQGDEQQGHGQHENELPGHEQQPVAEYQFEDEAEAVPWEPEAQDGAPELVAVPAAKPTGPKLSVGSKTAPPATDAGVKLSSLLGDSRSQAVSVEQAEAAVPDSLPSHRESSSAHKESLSSAHHESALHLDSPNTPVEYGAPVHTKSHNNESIWGDIVFQQESKATLKFRIVQEQDSLSDLAERYQTSVNELVRANKLTSQQVGAGQVLIIPN